MILIQQELFYLTDDGDLNHKLTSPKKDVKKIYEVTLQNPLKGDEKELFFKWRSYFKW